MEKIFINWMERGWIPDVLIRFGIRQLCRKRLKDLSASDYSLENYARGLAEGPLAFASKEANEQHYEVPTEFFLCSLGKNRKYSCAYFANDEDSLDQAEEAALSITVERAELQDGMDILELGCGWGSLSLYMASKFPNARVVAVSNSNTQRLFIEAQARKLNLQNLTVRTLDLSREPLPEGAFDRVVSVEMFEHFRNYRILLSEIHTRLKSGGKLFVHIFTHRLYSYPFETEGDDNWMGKYFFTGGQMPARNLLPSFAGALTLEQLWQWNGTHYARTAEAWLAKMDAHEDQILTVFKETYGSEAARWVERWRVFFMSCSELFGYDRGEEWAVTHYLFSKDF